jgi:hypothetical protein
MEKLFTKCGVIPAKAEISIFFIPKRLKPTAIPAFAGMTPWTGFKIKPERR